MWRETLDRVQPGWEITLADLSPGMLEEARRNLASVPERFRYVEADIQHLPFRDRSFDAVLANHMLYHVPDRPRALSEILRVLVPGGRLYAATNGAAHLGKIRELIRRVNPDVTPQRRTGFGLESGAVELAPYFERVTLYPYENILRVTDAEALKAYVRSMRDFYGLDDGKLREAERVIEEEMARDGAIEIVSDSGLFVAE